MRTLLKVLSSVIPIAFMAAIGIAVLLLPQRESGSMAGGEWTCSMHPQVRRPGPGQCPICGMNLIPVEQLAAEQARMEGAGLEVEPVEYRELFKEIRTVGKLDYNERRVEFISAWVDGRIDRLYVDFTGVQVRKGDHLVDIYSPNLVVTQTEFLRALEVLANTKGDRTYAQEAVSAARTRLRLLGIMSEQLAEIEKSGKAQTHLTIYAPLGGTVIEKNVRTGQYVKEGDPLYRIADLDPIWLYLDIYEYDQAWVRPGQKVDVTLETYPGEVFTGTITFIDPFLDDRTRTVKVRVNLKNAERKLKPAMYATAIIRIRLRSDGTPEPTGLEGKFICPMHPEVVSEAPGKCHICDMALERVPELPELKKVHGAKANHSSHDEHTGHSEHAAALSIPAQPGKVLAVRATAVLQTGRRAIVYRKRADGAYEMVEPALGPRAEGEDGQGMVVGYYPVLGGLKPGDQVVIRGGFLLDSQRQIEGMPSLLYPEGRSAASLHSGHGEATPPPPVGGHKH